MQLLSFYNWKEDGANQKVPTKQTSYIKKTEYQSLFLISVLKSVIEEIQ